MHAIKCITNRVNDLHWTYLTTLVYLKPANACYEALQWPSSQVTLYDNTHCLKAALQKNHDVHVFNILIPSWLIVTFCDDTSNHEVVY